MAVYIKGVSVISPQDTFGKSNFPGEIKSPAEGRFTFIEPLYREYLDPMASRRMSRIVKTSVCCAMKCLKDTGVVMPDAVIAGTGLGCLEDTEKFLSSIYSNEEKLLNPTPFIQSTHNTVAGAIALALKCHNYNSTYTHRGFSFESAMADTIMQLSDSPEKKILTGAFDELTESTFAITSRLGLWKHTMPGEGVAFFVMSGEKSDGDFAKLHAVDTFHKPEDINEIQNRINTFLQKCGVQLSDVDLAVFGMVGNPSSDAVYNDLIKDMFSATPYTGYKQLCGEYDTSSAFALWLSSVILKQGSVPDILMNRTKLPAEINHILIYNHLRGKDHSLYLLEKC